MWAIKLECICLFKVGPQNLIYIQVLIFFSKGPISVFFSKGPIYIFLDNFFPGYVRSKSGMYKKLYIDFTLLMIGAIFEMI